MKAIKDGSRKHGFKSKSSASEVGKSSIIEGVVGIEVVVKEGIDCSR